jgi:superfamily II DNA or RNA helicase
MHADHKIPWSKGGRTEIENCDVLTPEENLQKGGKVPMVSANANRFAWQDEFMQKYILHTDPNFFLCALPGAGKTKASIRVIKNWVAEGGVFVICVPTLPIRRNWRENLRNAGLYVDENFYGTIREGYSGAAITYSALHGLCGVLKKLCSDQSVLLVSDEIHHASENEESTWGVDLRESFVLAKRRLLLSGTPVRSDKETTSFLTIEDDPDNPGEHRYKMHFLFDWPRALKDKVVRALTFHRVKMEEVKVKFPKEDQTFCNNDERYLYYALDSTDFLLSILRQANDKLDILRRTDSTAGAMAVCKDISHAKVVYGLLELLGQNPVLVTSKEEEDSVKVIDEFNQSIKKWIVSVRQVSEGVDVPRLRILCYLTHSATELIFRQLVGRCVRRRENEIDAEATGHVFIPETPKLTKLADKIESLQALAFKKGKGGDPPVPGDIGVTIGGSNPIFIGYIIHGKRYEGDRLSVVQQLINKYSISEMSASLMIDDRDFAHGLRIGEDEADIISPVAPEPPWVLEERLRLECGAKTKRLIQIRQTKHGQQGYDRKLWEQLAQRVGREFMIDKTPTRKLSISQLKRKLDKLREAIIREGNLGNVK